MENIDYEAIAKQLSNPEGEDGIKTGLMMQEGNGEMCRRTIDALQPANNDTILEIGPGNGAHLTYLLAKANDIRYKGIDISETMVQQAKEINAATLQTGQAEFSVGNGVTLPYADGMFNRIFTVNTIYFWEKPEAQLNEIYRVLKPGGTFALAFRSKRFMQHLPFTPFGFTLYDAEDAVRLLETAGFKPKQTLHETEESLSIMEMTMEKDRIIVLAEK